MRKIAVAAVPVALVAGWSALWGLAAHEAGGRVDGFLAAEAEQGRDWRCPDRRIGGYPFALVLRCAAPTYAGQAGGQHVEGSLGGAEARVSLAAPRRVALTLQGPFAYKTSDGATSVEGHWRSLTVDLSPLPGIRSVAIRGAAVAVSGLFVGEQAGGAAASLDVTATLEAPPPGGDPGGDTGGDATLRFAVALGGAALPPLDEVLGGTAPVDASLAGRLDRADVGDVQTPEQAMERWRLAGGRVRVDAFSASRAGARVTATGTLGLDDRHRPEGKLAAEFFGLEPILKRYGISANLAAVGSLFGALFGGGPRPSAPGALALPVTLADGHVSVGPVGTGVELTPLY